MMDLFFGGGATVFSIAAIIGTLFFLLRTVMLFVGAADFDADVDVDTDVGADVSDASSEAFQIISIQGILAFLMGFGWGGLSAFKGLGLPFFLSVPIAAVAGGAMVWFLGKLLVAVYRLQSEGTVHIHQALGLDAEVYIEIPGEQAGSGQIRVVIDDHERYLQAKTPQGGHPEPDPGPCSGRTRR